MGYTTGEHMAQENTWQVMCSDQRRHEHKHMANKISHQPWCAHTKRDKHT